MFQLGNSSILIYAGFFTNILILKPIDVKRTYREILQIYLDKNQIGSKAKVNLNNNAKKF